MTAINLNQYLPPISLHRQWIGLVFTILLFLLFPKLIRYIDISAAPIDAGIISALILSIVAILSFKAVTWWLIKSVWPLLATYSRNQFENDFQSLSSWQKILIFLAFYLSLLFSFVFTLAAIV
ncbi:hypothetical protein [Pedobacter sp. SYSU D00535]|uniref:hypothetical protein n=1 Tax=Pedobacter sp. SYSU D00535 TaxID=2810308 RepID=UPI001A95A733|nr:hypothetical protein [Pedobacter sp. SYSU D00535]